MSTSTTTPEMSPEFQKQEEFRQNKIQFYGGSEIGGLYNLEPYGCRRRVFNIKTDVVPNFPFFGNNLTRRGQTLEQFAADVYAEQTGRTVRHVAPKCDEVAPMLRPQPDFEIVNNARGPEWGRGLLSVKVPGKETFFKTKQAITMLTGPEPRTEWERTELERGKQVLRPYILQLQAEMAAQKVKWGSFAFFWADGFELKYVDIDRDDVIINDIRAQVVSFWRDKEAGIAPPKLDPKARQCKSCEFRVSCQSEHLVKLLEKEGDSETAIIPELDAVVSELRVLEEAADNYAEQIDGKKDIIRHLLEEAQTDVAEGGQVKIYNRLQDGRNTFKAADYFKAFPDLREQGERFWNKGKPFRVLKVYDLAKGGGAQ